MEVKINKFCNERSTKRNPKLDATDSVPSLMPLYIVDGVEGELMVAVEAAVRATAIPVENFGIT